MGIKIVLVDDDSLIRESFKIMLSYDEHIEIMKVFGDGMDAIEYCSKEKVDIALLDVRMPRINGIQATREIVKRSNTKVIILTTFDEDEYIAEAMKFGARGYILKNSTSNKILDTIKNIYIIIQIFIKFFFVFYATFNGCKVTGGHRFIILTQ